MLRAAKVPRARDLVEAALGGSPTTPGGLGSPVEFEALEPWPEPVAGAALLDGVADFYRGHVVLPANGPEALALWTVHTYVAFAAETTPYLVLTSPTPRCGKTRTLQIATALCYRPLPSSNITEAALYRVVEKLEPTLLIDEGDTFLKKNPHFTGILNSGHTRATAFVYRCVGDDAEPRRFNTFGPKMIALIGGLPAAATADRSIILPMRRKTKSEQVLPVKKRRLFKDLEDYRRRILRWTVDILPSLETAEPELPASLDDRAADNWQPLIALADAAGGRWPAHARKVACLLSGYRADDPSVGVELLTDIRSLFGDRRIVFLGGHARGVARFG